MYYHYGKLQVVLCSEVVLFSERPLSEVPLHIIMDVNTAPHTESLAYRLSWEHYLLMVFSPTLPPPLDSRGRY